MNCLRICLISFVMASIALYAGGPVQIEKGSATQKEMKLSVAHKDSPQDQNKVMITVTFKGDNHTKVNLINSGKNVELKTVVKDGMVSMSFEIEKTHLGKSSLRIINPEAIMAKCDTGLHVDLNEYVN